MPRESPLEPPPLTDDVDGVADDHPAEFEDTPAAAQFVRGRLRAALPFWQQMVRASAFILSVIEFGYSLAFDAAKGLPQRAFFPNHGSAIKSADFVSRAIAELLATGAAVETTCPSYVVSPLGVATRADGKQRLILDLRYVNWFLPRIDFRYESLSDLRELLPSKAWLGACDLKSGYHHVDLHPDSWRYMGFAWRDAAGVLRYYEFRSLPFGCSTAPHCFTLLTRDLAAYFRSNGVACLVYLDDFLFWGATRWAATQAASFFQETLRLSGFLVNTSKSHFTPTQRLDHLGFTIDTLRGVFEVPVARWERFRVLATSLSTRVRASARELVTVAGHIMSFSLAAGRLSYMYSRSFYWLADQRTSWSARLALTPEIYDDLAFWLSIQRHALCSRIRRPASRPSLVLKTDASDHGYGAVLHTSCNLVTPAAEVSDLLPTSALDESSTLRELSAVHSTVQALHAQLAGREVLLHCDNTGTVAIINKGGSPGPALHRLCRDLHYLLMDHGISLTAQWVRRTENTAADALSRRSLAAEWMLHQRHFDLIWCCLGPFSVDLFASAATRQPRCPQFHSEYWCPGTSGVDAFATCWRALHSPRGKPWINAPFGLLPRVLAKLEEDAADAVVLVPLWPSRPWWPSVAPDGAHWCSAARAVYHLPPAHDLFHQLDGSSAPTKSRAFAAVWFDFRPSAPVPSFSRCIFRPCPAGCPH